MTSPSSTERLVGRTITAAEQTDNMTVTLTLDTGERVEFAAWASYADDAGLDVEFQPERVS